MNVVRTIVVVNDFGFVNGGAGKVAISSAIRLADLGYRVIFFCGVMPIEKGIAASNIEVKCLNQLDILNEPNRLKAAGQGIWNFQACKEMEKLLATLDPESTIVHFHGTNKCLSSSVYHAVQKLNFKLLITLHEFFLFCPNGGLFNYKKQQICRIKPSSLKCYLCNCDSRSYPQKIWRDIRQLVQWYQLKKYGKFNVITIGQTNENVSKPSLSKYVKKWYRVQNPIDLSNNVVVDIEKNDTYLFIARLSAEKGIDLFCQCMTELHLKGCVLGDGYLLEEYKKKYPNIEFTGWISGKEKERYIKKAKALIFPSLWYEGAPLTPVEMKSYGIPCVVPNKCAAAEVIIDGIDGYIFKIGDLVSLKEAILKYENTDLKAMQSRLLANFDPLQYSMDAHINNLIKCYEDILRRR